MNHAKSTIEDIKKSGLYKTERQISSAQGNRITVGDKKEVLNLCANNYLGLSNHPEIVEAAIAGLEKWGFGLSSVRFICGTQDIHKELEERISNFLGTEDTILYASCFDANGGLFETILNEEDVVISDELNHASIIDGIRLSKAKRFRYKNNNPSDLEEKLKEVNKLTPVPRQILIATDGVFSMDGHVANLKEISALAEKYNAMLMIDDCHAVGFMGATGRGTHEHHNLVGKIDIITGTLGKALGGALGGYTSGKKEIIELLRQKSRPYLFSNSLPPMIVAASLKALDILERSTELRDEIHKNTKFFRAELLKTGLDIIAGDHPIIPVMLYDANISAKFASRMMDKGVYVVSFSYPVVPNNMARIRTQVSALHTIEDLSFATNAFKEVKEELL